MFRVPSSPNGLWSDAGDSDAPAAGPVRTPSTSSAAAETPPLRPSSAMGWQDDHTVISRTDIKDRQTDSRNNRRAAGGRLKHKWSAVKLVSPAKYIAEEQARAPGQSAVDRFRALSPASQEALLQQRERQSVGPQDSVQREQIPPQSPTPATKKLAAVIKLDEEARVRDFRNVPNSDLNHAGVERHLEPCTCPDHVSNRTAEQSQNTRRNGARVQVAPINLDPSKFTAATLHGVPVSLLKSTITTDRHAAAPSTTEEEKKKRFVNGFKRALNAQEAKLLTAAGVEQADTSTSVPDILHLCDPSSQFTRLASSPVHRSAPRQKNTVKEERLLYTEHDLKAMKQRSARRSIIKPADVQEVTHSHTAKASCSGCWGGCRECSRAEWSTAAEPLESNSERSLDGVSPPDHYDDDRLGDDEAFSGIRTEGGSMMLGPVAPRYMDDGPQWSLDALANLLSNMISPDLTELAPQKSRTLYGSTRASDSDDEATDAPVFGSGNDEDLQQHLMEEFADDDEVARSRSSTPIHYKPTSGSDAQEARQVKATSACDCWCNVSVTDHCNGCKNDCGHLDDAPGDFPRDDDHASEKSLNVADSVLREVLESTVEKDQATEFLTPPRRSDQPLPSSFAKPLKDALRQLGLEQYHSVDMDLLQQHLKERLTLSENNHSTIASAFAIVVKHQDVTGCWDLRLRWDFGSDFYLSSNHAGTQHDDWSLTADHLSTTSEDCRQRWATIKPKSWRPESTCKCDGTFTLSCCCCLEETWTPEINDKLLILKADRISWIDIANSIDKTVKDCKNRFDKIKPKGWKPKSKKQIKKEKAAASKKQKAEKNSVAVVSENITHNARDATGGSWEAPVWGHDNIDNRSVDAWDTGNNNNEVRKCGCKIDTACWCDAPMDDEAAPSHERMPGLDLIEAYALFELFAMSDRQHVDLSVLQSVILIAPPSEAAKLEKAFGLICHDQTQNYGQACCEDCGLWDYFCCCWGGPFISKESKQDDQGWNNHTVYCWDCGSAQDWCTCTSRPPVDAAGWPAPPLPDTNCWEASSHHQSDSKPQPAPYTPPTVTYWATIKSAGKEIYVPMDSKNVTGPEKSIANSGMQKVWKWVHEKGLGDKVGLQDAFDLAQSMHKEEDAEEVKAERAESRTESRLSYHTLGTDSRYEY